MQLHRIRKVPSQDRILVVEAGEVICPRAGVVDLERCWVCPAYGGLSTGHLEGVVCQASGADLWGRLPPPAGGQVD